MHFEKVKKTIAPCLIGEECISGKPDLYIGNHLAWELYQKVSGQVIVAGMGEIIGIQFSAIEFILSIYQIYDPDVRCDLFEKILLIDTVRIKMKNGELAAKMKKEKKK